MATERGKDAPPAPHLARGARGEGIALDHLVREGWTPVARNWRSPLGELDLVVTRGDTLAFVEVKTRATAEDDGFQPEDAVTPSKRRRLVRAARAWLVENEARAARLYPRFDVITVVGEGPGRVVEHLEDAFEAGGG